MLKRLLAKVIPSIKEIEKLGKYHKDRLSGSIRDAGADFNRRLWSTLGTDEEKITMLREVASSGRRIEKLINSNGWKDVLEAKVYYQSLYDWKTKNPGLSEKERFQAACEWAAIEGFFKELSSRVRKGREAEKKLSKVGAEAYF